jgi:hypothetical protein
MFPIEQWIVLSYFRALAATPQMKWLSRRDRRRRTPLAPEAPVDPKGELPLPFFKRESDAEKARIGRWLRLAQEALSARKKAS